MVSYDSWNKVRGSFWGLLFIFLPSSLGTLGKAHVYGLVESDGGIITVKKTTLKLVWEFTNLTRERDLNHIAWCNESCTT